DAQSRRVRRDHHGGDARIARARRADHQGSAQLSDRMNDGFERSVTEPPAPGRRAAALPFIFIVVFIDVLGIGLAMPVLPMLVGAFTPSRELQAYWYGVLVVVYGLMQFFCAPLLGALSDRFGRRPVILASIFGLGLHYLLLAVAPSLAFVLRRANPFSALLALSRHREIGRLVLVFALVVLAQLILQTTWVLFTHFRFGWGPRENGFALFCVGVVAAVVQGALLGPLLRRFGEVRLALTGLSVGTIAYLLYGLAPQGWIMYAIIVGNFLSFAAGPALQGIVSNAVGPREQGVTMGALNSIQSTMFVVAPAIGAPLLAQASHLPQSDWKVGVTLL